MATYKVRAPSGDIINVQGPDGATDAQVMAAAQKLYATGVWRQGQPGATVGADKRAGVGGAIDAFMRGAAGGATFNTDDEASAALNSVLPVDKLAGNAVYSLFEDPNAYQHNLQYERAVNSYDSQNHPVARALGMGAGAIAGAIGGTRLGVALGQKLGATALGARAGAATQAAARAIPVLPKVLGSPVGKGVAAGAGYGAASGFGAGESPSGRVKGAVAGAGVGGITGGAAAGVITGLGPAVAKYWNVLMGKGVTRQALSQLRASLAHDGFDVTSPGGTAALQTELSRFAGKPVSLADVGPVTRARTAIGLRTPSAAQGPAVTAVAQRAAGQGQRLTGDVTATVAPRTDVHALDDALVAQRADAAGPLKASALKNSDGSPVIVSDPVLQGLARLPLAQDALNSAKTIAAATRDRLNVQGLPTDHLPDFPQPGAPLDMGSLDYLKRSLDDAVHSAATSSESGTRAMFPELRDLRDAIKTRMRAVGETAPGAGDGPYGQYLDQYAGASELKDALAAGRGADATTGSRTSVPGFNQMDPEVIAAQQAHRSVAGQEMYRVGAARNLVDTVNATPDGSYPASRLLNSPEARSQLAATGVDADALARLNQAVEQERQMNLLPQAAGVTPAASVGREINASGDIGHDVPYALASPTHWLAVAGRKALGAVNLNHNEAVNAALLPAATSTDPAAIAQTITQLQANGQYEAAAALQRQAQTQAVAKFLGIDIGGAVAPPGN